MDTLVVLGHRLGRDEAQHLLEFPLQQLFACFDPYAYKQEADTSCDRSDSPAAIGEEEVKALFTPALAHWAYIPLCQLIGQIRMRELIINHELIEQMAYGYDMQQHEIKMKVGDLLVLWNVFMVSFFCAPRCACHYLFEKDSRHIELSLHLMLVWLYSLNLLFPLCVKAR